MKRFHSVIMLIMICLSLFLFGNIASFAHAENDEVIQLRLRIVELENRIKQLEGLLTENAHKDVKIETGWQNKKNWRKLKTGMTAPQVQKILGEPIKIIEGIQILWYYPNIYCGYCSFDEKGHLVSWNEP
ncbi:MAG: outer membrane protein assembly factor BamE [Pseudomonadota bacterium]